ncbi:MAG: hypothetical protein HZB71_14465 [Betaproteobacteria bacterium]|nr:hypothetical protein [Betaproteobacteria bacterium]
MRLKDSLEPGVLSRLEAGLKSQADPAMTLEVRYVQEIPRTASGKHSFVIGLK